MGRIVVIVVTATVLFGCASASEVYMPDGRKGYALNCSGMARDWGMCLKAAGEMCQVKGYDIFMRDASTGSIASIQASGNFSPYSGSYGASGFGSTVFNRELLVACKS
jgi:hypothetical protein